MTRDPKQTDPSPSTPSADGDARKEHTENPALEGPPPRDVILLDSIPVGPGQVVDIVVPRDRSVPPPDELIDPFESAEPEQHRHADPTPAAAAEAKSRPKPPPKRLRLSDLWRRLLRLWRASSRSS